MTDVAEVVKGVLPDLVSARHWRDSSFVNLPLLYPGGDSVTVKVDRAEGGHYRVSDSGFAYREAESIGAQISFGRVLTNVVEAESLQRTSRTVYVEVPSDQLFRAICDVGAASWRVAEKVYSLAPEGDEAENEDYVRERVIEAFGPHRIEPTNEIVGLSTNKWEVTAIVKSDGAATVFQAVGIHPNTIYRTSTEFHDLAGLPKPPKLVAVVRNKKALGVRYALLSQAGHVIQEDQPDDAYLRAAA